MSSVFLVILEMDRNIFAVSIKIKQKNMDSKTIGGKIAKARKQINMSQAQLAGLLFISPQAVGKWERGESIPDIITINRLAEILGVDFNYFSENFESANDETTVKMTIDNIRDTDPPIQEIVKPSTSQERPLLTNFSGSNLPKSDFSGVTANKRKFNGSALRGSDFSGADLSGSSFNGSDVRETNFEGANLTGSSFKASDVSGANFDRTDLTDCTLSTIDLTDASFNKSILVRTEFNMSGLIGAKFTDTTLSEVKLTMTDLSKTIFENCVFNGVDFKYSDMRALCLDGQTFIDVRFDKAALNEATFNGATLKNVSFRPTYALTNKYYRAIKTICFDGAMMDKLTYASLKGMGADLSKVTII